MKKVIVAVSMFALLFLASEVRVSSQTSAQDQQQSQSGTPHRGMMGGGMMGMMSQMNQMNQMMDQMSAHHHQMMDLMGKLMDSMKAINSEKNPEALKQKLAEHQALLEQMRTLMMQQGGMMKQMMGKSNDSAN